MSLINFIGKTAEIQMGSIISGSNKNRKGQLRKWTNCIAVGVPFVIKNGPAAGTKAVKVRNPEWSATDAYSLNLESFIGTVNDPAPTPAPVAPTVPVKAVIPGLTAKETARLHELFAKIA
jgi:hypothetical protein